ncbi:MAG: hypothetical protein ABJ139_01700, partial [Paracoccaceae bacterium]
VYTEDVGSSSLSSPTISDTLYSPYLLRGKKWAAVLRLTLFFGFDVFHYESCEQEIKMLILCIEYRSVVEHD